MRRVRQEFECATTTATTTHSANLIIVGSIDENFVKDLVDSGNVSITLPNSNRNGDENRQALLRLRQRSKNHACVLDFSFDHLFRDFIEHEQFFGNFLQRTNVRVRAQQNLLV